MTRGIAKSLNLDLSRFNTKTFEFTAPLKSFSVAATGEPNAAIGSITHVSASGPGASSVSVSSVAATGDRGSFTSVNIWAEGTSTFGRTTLFSDDLF
jgi:hypothetical protein